MRAPFILAAALAAGMAAARGVRLESVVCNPGTRVTVPATLDEARGLAVVTLTVNYDPLVLDFVEAREGTLADAFSFDFSVAEETGSVTVVAVAPADIAESRGGTVAEFVFDVRPGSEALHSPLALADVRLEEETLTRDLTHDEAIAPTGGLVRPLAEGGDCLTRLGDQPVVVAAGTTLRRLALADGDALQATAGGDPVTLSEAVEAPAPIRVAPPPGGWLPGRYALLRQPAGTGAPDFRIAEDAALAHSALSRTVDGAGFETYALEVSDGTPLAQAGDTVYTTVDAIPDGAVVTVLPGSPLLEGASLRTVTAAGRGVAGAEAQVVARLLGGRFVAAKTADGPTKLTYAYDLGVAGVTMRDGTLRVTVGLREDGQAPTESRTLTGREAVVAFGTREVALADPVFVPDRARGMALCVVEVPLDALPVGATALRVSIRDKE